MTISISPGPDTSNVDNIADQIAAMPKPMPWRQDYYPFASPWNINVPYYDSYDAYMKAHPPLAISWTDQAKHYASWNDYLAEHPWYVTAIAMNRSPQIDAEGRFIDGLVGPLDYLTTVGSGGIGFAGLDQGGDYKGYSQTSGAYLTEQSWRAGKLDRLMRTLAAETAYDPEVAKMWEDAAVAKAERLETWNRLLDDLVAAGLDGDILDALKPPAGRESDLARLLKDAGEGVQRGTPMEQGYQGWLENLNGQEDVASGSGREGLSLQYLLLQQQSDYAARQEIIDMANEFNEVSDEDGNLSRAYFEQKYEKAIEEENRRYEEKLRAKMEEIEKTIEEKETATGQKWYKVPGGYSTEKYYYPNGEEYQVDPKYLFVDNEAGFTNRFIEAEGDNYFHQRKAAVERFLDMSDAERAELLADENLTDAGREALSDKRFTDLTHQLIHSVFSKEGGFACIPLL